MLSHMAGPKLDFDLHTLNQCAGDVANALGKWRRYIAVEKNLSRHTLRAYISDVSQFIGFLSQHHACEVSLNLLSAAGIRDFRSWQKLSATEFTYLVPVLTVKSTGTKKNNDLKDTINIR